MYISVAFSLVLVSLRTTNALVREDGVVCSSPFPTTVLWDFLLHMLPPPFPFHTRYQY
jgi:hypothetical protein